MTQNHLTGRLAPSPTGYLHLGNAWSFLLCWLFVRSQSGRLVLRMDDIDPLRSRAEFARAIREDLLWLGIDWDEEVPPQSTRLGLYEIYLDKLRNHGLVYPCFCTRKELKMLASAPHAEDGETPYPGICASLTPEETEKRIQTGAHYALRLRMPTHIPEASDLLYGRYHSQSCGDFPLKRSDGVISYQLATVADDFNQNINFICRGRDLLSSTPRQMVLQKYLGMPVPVYAHVPLLCDSRSERLAKRHESLSLKSLRQKGVSPEKIAGLLGRLAGFNLKDKATEPKALLDKFNWRAIPKHDICLKDTDLEDL